MIFRDSKVRIIAEAGINHNGDLGLAKELVDIADEAGADFVKFQSFVTSALVSKTTSQAKYQIDNNKSDASQFKMLSQYELTFEEQIELFEYCQQKSVQFLTTAFDNMSLDFVCNTLGMKTIKISSGDLTSLPFLTNIATRFDDIILSTGMGTLSDIQSAVASILFAKEHGEPSDKKELDIVWSEPSLLKRLGELTILHCTTNYPARLGEINLRAMETLRRAFGTKVGYSDHTQGNHVSIAAVAMGAEVIEKHFTINRNMDGPDHLASLEPDELKNLVMQIRETELAVGSHMKLVCETELKNREVVRKRIVAATSIKEGDVFTANNLEIKRSSQGLEASEYWGLIGKFSQRSYGEGDAVIG